MSKCQNRYFNSEWLPTPVFPVSEAQHVKNPGPKGTGHSEREFGHHWGFKSAYYKSLQAFTLMAGPGGVASLPSDRQERAEVTAHRDRVSTGKLQPRQGKEEVVRQGLRSTGQAM